MIAFTPPARCVSADNGVRVRIRQIATLCTSLAGMNLLIRLLKQAIGPAILIVFLIAPNATRAGVLIHVHRASQTLSVFVDGELYATWRVSTARRGYRTPAGTFHPSRLETVWYSSKYDNAPMPHAIFFAGGYAIHGTTAIRSLGRPVSHGCIRLHPAHARELFDLVRSHGRSATRIVISSHAVSARTQVASLLAPIVEQSSRAQSPFHGSFTFRHKEFHAVRFGGMTGLSFR